ncbi:helix-turn-helix transcriptional regulator [Paenibacillus alba]|uniref:LuxR C-terminal-related transcriptional regulator n=1 Tax=Paenibacillus alba TaxID=1197127 RepID=A0ABU6FZX6_9BACL|nr:LuxR C-terminal-related transcriptional regulator [Paenibacillus alba]MEC0227453.1 LuxR C-terminal-related transcriptional regulator [Paenibacillus alba]
MYLQEVNNMLDIHWLTELIREEVHFIHPYLVNNYCFLLICAKERTIHYIQSPVVLDVNYYEDIVESVKKRIIQNEGKSIHASWISHWVPINMKLMQVVFLCLTCQTPVEGKFIKLILDYIVRNVGKHESRNQSNHKLLDACQHFRLTKKEKEVANYLYENVALKEIANHLFISIQTVRTHIKRIYSKTGVRNRIDFIRKVQSY